MKFEIKSDDLITAVSLVERISKKRSVVNSPYVHGILIEAIGGDVVFTSMNNMGVRVQQEANIFDEGSVLIPGSLLYGVAVNLGSGVQVNIECSGTTLTILTKGNETSIEIYDKKEFPAFSKIDKKGEFSVHSQHLIHGIESVSYVASPTVARMVLATLYMHTKDKNLILVSSDPFRVARKEIKNTDIKNDVSLLIPIENIPDILYLIRSIRGMVTISYNDSYVSFSADNIYFFSSIFDGDYVDYANIIPQKTITDIEIEKQALTSFFKKVGYFSEKKDGYRDMIMEVNKEKNICVCTASTKGVGTVKDIIPAVIRGDSITERFNYPYIADSLQSITTDTLTISFQGEGQPILIQNKGEDTFSYVLAPLHTNE